MADVDSRTDLALMHGVARPCPDCGEERLFVPVHVTDVTGEYSCTWCGAGLLFEPTVLGGTEQSISARRSA